MTILAIIGALLWLALMASYVVFAVSAGRDIMSGDDDR